MSTQPTRKDKAAAAVGTALVLTLLLVWIILARFSITITPPEDRRWPPVDSSEIVFGGEYVKLGDMPLPQTQPNPQPASQESAPEPTHEGTDLADEGPAVAEEPALVASERPSPAKVQPKPKPQKQGPTKEELAERERIRRQNEQQAESRRISAGMKNSFNRRQNTSGTSGSPSGNSDDGVLAGTPGYSLKGRTPEAWGPTRSTLSGTITIRVRVNRQGHVVGTPTYVGGSGPAAAQQSIRQTCIEAARRSRFSVDLDAPSEQVGTITWTFK